MYKGIWMPCILLWFTLSCSPSPEKLFEAGVDAMKSGEFNKAIGFFERAVQADEGHAVAYNALGVAYYEQDNWDKSIEIFNKAIALDSTSYKPFFNRGNALLEKKEYRDAVVDYNYANRLDPSQTDIYYNRGLALLGMEAYEDALFDFDLALQADPSQAVIYFNKAKAQLGNNDPLGAMASLAEVIKLDKRNGAAFYLMGVTEMSALGEKESGCANLKMALSLGYTLAKEWVDEFCGE